MELWILNGFMFFLNLTASFHEERGKNILDRWNLNTTFIHILMKKKTSEKLNVFFSSHTTSERPDAAPN